MRVTDTKDERRWPPEEAYDVIPGNAPVMDGARITMLLDTQEFLLTYFERRIEPYGVVRVVTSPGSIDIWVGGERRYCGKKAAGS